MNPRLTRCALPPPISPKPQGNFRRGYSATTLQPPRKSYFYQTGPEEQCGQNLPKLYPYQEDLPFTRDSITSDSDSGICADNLSDSIKSTDSFQNSPQRSYRTNNYAPPATFNNNGHVSRQLRNVQYGPQYLNSNYLNICEDRGNIVQPVVKTPVCQHGSLPRSVSKQKLQNLKVRFADELRTSQSFPKPSQTRSPPKLPLQTSLVIKTSNRLPSASSPQLVRTIANGQQKPKPPPAPPKRGDLVAAAKSRGPSLSQSHSSHSIRSDQSSVGPSTQSHTPTPPSYQQACERLRSNRLSSNGNAFSSSDLTVIQKKVDSFEEVGHYDLNRGSLVAAHSIDNLYMAEKIQMNNQKKEKTKMVLHNEESRCATLDRVTQSRTPQFSQCSSQVNDDDDDDDFQFPPPPPPFQNPCVMPSESCDDIVHLSSEQMKVIEHGQRKQLVQLSMPKRYKMHRRRRHKSADPSGSGIHTPTDACPPLQPKENSNYSDLVNRQIKARLLGLDCHGVQLLELQKEDKGPFGFFIATGCWKKKKGVFISRVTAKCLTPLLTEGDEILAIDSVVLKGKNIEQVQQLICDKDKLVLKVLPSLVR